MESNNLTIDQIRSNYKNVLERIEGAANSCDRDLNDIKLVVVSKAKSINSILNAIEAGIMIFGENYAEEAVSKINFINNPNIQWHMIGHIQSRKARMVVENFDYIHSLDSLRLAKRLNRYAQDINKKLPTLVEFNVSGEESKYGFSAWEENNWSELIPTMEQILDFPYISVRGLMTIPPYLKNPERTRLYYQLLVRLKNFLQSNFDYNNWIELSMGMSADFEIAIEEGATWIRVGQAILGRRSEH